MSYHLLHLLVNHLSILVVAEELLHKEASQISRYALPQPQVRPFFGGDEASIILTSQCMGSYLSCFIHLIHHSRRM